LSLAAQDALTSGPTAGTPLPKAVVYAPTGPKAGVEFDVAEAIGKAPGAVLFVHEVSRNTAPVIRGFDDLGFELSLLGFKGFAVRIAADRTEAESASARQSQAISMHSPMVVSVDGAEGPGAYALNRRCTLTLVTCNDGKVVASHAYTDVGAKDLPAIRKALEQVAGKLPADEPALRKLLAQKLPDDPVALRAIAIELAVELARKGRAAESRPGSRGMRPAAMEDPQLQGLVRAIIQQDADQQALDRAFAAVDKHVAGDAAKTAAAAQFMKNFITAGYGTEDARKRAQAWVDAHAK
jgi:hypothetical protein